ncbi:iron complex transport system permease protein [Loktanella sp. DSM 29012]|uniref:iron chelate uptake ABC transporter family permease subunit n=1 Tax=Loktanella sp. DSM 29012 TaxID=1881056 RepID=UPI0008C7F97A|nr:iron chelate uptake ABC transporter family permease subunit [Loktanella sp. DSM 29012]SEQ60832.1 iron complex transport system permease protein [Loktanella sp. DSM 29012]
MAERRLFALLGLLALLSALFLGWGLREPAGFILSLRAVKLASLLVVGAAIGAATVMFQTVAANRLLTPGIVGFDALFVFLQTGLVLLLGGAGFATLPDLAKFGAELLCMLLAGVALFGVMLRRGAEDVLRLVLTGVILGVFLRGLSGFAGRLLDPSEYSIVQQASFATFGAVDSTQLAIAAAVLAAALTGASLLAPSLDAAALGSTTARAIGLPFDRIALLALVIVSACVAASTALVGPITFLGLLAASLAHAVLRTWRHALLIPGAAIIGASILVAGQFVFERLLGQQSTLAVIVECVGGLLFLFLVLRKSRP